MKKITLLVILAALCSSNCFAQDVALQGLIKADGSSTVYPITEAVAEEFIALNSKVKVTVGISGTGGGFKKFIAGETDISNASRPIKATETEAAEKAGIKYLELPVAYDALTIVINPKNTWAKSITVKELKKIWEPAAQGKITTWKQVREEWPDTPLTLFGPGTDSGTFDYFTEAIVGKEDSSRGDYTSSEDDNVLVQGVARNVGALGFFGFSYYEENIDKLKALAVDDEDPSNGDGAQLPTVENVEKGVYRPLARPVFVYFSAKSLERAEVSAFAKFFLENGQQLVTDVGYIPLPKTIAELASARFISRKLGSIYTNAGSNHNLEELLSK